jgi:hypothetical protein
MNRLERIKSLEPRYGDYGEDDIPDWRGYE